jgi:predicted component of type VI protein secretion system
LRATQRESIEHEEGKILKLRLSLNGRPIKTFVFNKAPVVIGRSPDCDVFLDNPGVSREHLRVERTPDGGFEAIDLGSANGTLLNSRPLKRAYITQDDVLQIGKFTLWIAISNDRRADPSGSPRMAAMAKEEGTTVLSTEELERMMTKAKETFRYEEAPPSRQPQEEEEEEAEEWDVPSGPSRLVFAVSIAIAFVFGAAIGAVCMRLLIQ